jgi:hypothetical protein
VKTTDIAQPASAVLAYQGIWDAERFEHRTEPRPPRDPLRTSRLPGLDCNKGLPPDRDERPPSGTHLLRSGT